MADISTFDEAMDAIHAGADLIATTLVGYTPYSHPVSIPDFELIEKLVRFSPVPVVVEGHVSTPTEARLAFDLGAYAVVVGAAITQPQWITRQFVNAIQTTK
jgi:N-acylglucosamine-6-phosphate 2-epimerase